MSDDFHFSTEVRVRLPETDVMGIVFHGCFFTYMEVGRMDYLRNLGLPPCLRECAAVGLRRNRYLGNRSILAAITKSLSVRPLILCVQRSTRTLPQARYRSG